MSCPTEWRDRDGEHSCRHAAGHETRRHSCQCGSWPGVHDATLIDSHGPGPALSGLPVVEVGDGLDLTQPVVPAN